MRALWRTGWADLRARRLTTVLFLLVVAVATAGITAGLAQQQSAAERWDDAFARANGAHVALYGDAATLRRIRADREVVQAAGPSPVASATLLRAGADPVEDFDVRAAGARRAAVATPLLFDGRWLSGRDPGEVVIERSLALDQGIEVGDTVALRSETATVSARVVGVALDLVDCFYPQCESQTAWATAPAVARLAPRDAPRSLLLARIADPDAVEAFKTRIQRTAGDGLTDAEDWLDTRADALVLNEFFGAFLAAFGVFLLIAAGVVVLSSVGARVLARYRELGILKALGFTPRALTVLVLGENLAIAALGAALGVVAGGLLAPSLQLQMATVLERGRATFPAAVIAGAVLIVLVLVIAATVVPARRAGRVPASRAIARGAAPVSTRPSRLARAAVRLRLGAPVAVGLKDATARPLRAYLAIAALAVTVIAIVATLAFDRAFGEIADDPALAGDPQAMTIEAGDVAPERLRAALARTPGVGAWFTVTERQAAVGDVTFQVRVIGGDPARTGYVVREGRMPAGPGEIVAGYGLLERLGLHVGERAALRVGGRPLDVRIVGRYAEFEDSGERGIITFADLRRLEPGADPGVLFVDVAAGADPDRVARAVAAAAPGAKVTVEEVELDELDAFRAAFIAISLLVLAVGLVNLGATTVLGIRERRSDIAVLKTLGFTPRQVGLSIAAGTAMVAVAAVVVGVPVGLLAADAMLTGVGRSSGFGPELSTLPAAGSLGLAALGLIVLAAGLGAVVARRVARARVADALRAE